MRKSFEKHNCLIFTDLDGTLLDHETYRFDAALPALEQIRDGQIPLVINTSKTVPEIIAFREQIRNPDPFIAENGSVIGIPENYFPSALCREYETLETHPGFLFRCLGGERRTVLEILHALRREHRFMFTGFSDLSAGQIAEITGLNPAAAKLAGKRLSTEPVLWEDTARKKSEFLGLLADQGLQAVQGGRFLSISFPFDKKDGVAALFTLYRAKLGEKPLAVGLGDSPNDLGMLEMMDIAVVVRSARSDTVCPTRPDRVIRTSFPGPEGWQEAMTQILNDMIESTND